MKIVVAQGAVGGRCNAAAEDLTVPASGITSLRLSVLRTTGETRSFVCDRVFKVPKEQPHLKLPIGGAEAFDIVAEGFADSGGAAVRKASGELLGVNPADGMVKELDNLRMLPTESSSCTENPLSTGRAFHTATKLPNGQVLIIGGLVASSTNPAAEDVVTDNEGEKFQLSTSNEVFDEKTGRFTTVTTATPRARAFHNAFLINDTPPYKILVVGGATIDDPAVQAFGVSNTFPTGPRIVPLSAFAPLTTKAAHAEIMTWDPTTNTLTGVEVNGFTEALYQAGGQFANGGTVSDGIDYKQTGTATPVLQTAALRGIDASARAGTSTVPRYGATLTTLHDSNQLLWGGNYDMNTFEPIGEYIAGATGGTISRTNASGTGEIATAFHTATVYDATATTSEILFTGGFTFTATTGAALNVIGITEAVRTASYVPGNGMATEALAGNAYTGYTVDAACLAADRYRPAGWESAVALGRKRVLVSGGAPAQTLPSVTPECHDCPDGEASLLCALQQMSLWDGETRTLRKFASLAVGRMGHTSTLLGDGTVLIVGGINTKSSVARVLKDAEILNPRTAAPPSPDLDDPIAAELATAGVVRVPGKPATLPTATDKASNLCSTL